VDGQRELMSWSGFHSRMVTSSPAEAMIKPSSASITQTALTDSKCSSMAIPSAPVSMSKSCTLPSLLAAASWAAPSSTTQMPLTRPSSIPASCSPRAPAIAPGCR
jgi:hypothetical protein